MRPLLSVFPLTHRLLALLAFVTSLVTGQAQLTFTITATANTNGFGYTSGQGATFTFTTNGADLSGNGSNRFYSYVNAWYEETTTEAPIYTAITGTGLGGTYTRPHLNLGDPLAYLEAQEAGGNQLTLEAGAEAVGSNIGLTANGNNLTYLIAGQLDWGQSFATPQAYTPLNTFFAPYLGTHALSGGYVELYANGTAFDLTATSITISAIPEPPVAALVAGLGGLAVASAIRRRRR